MNTINIAIVGCGFSGTRFLKIIEFLNKKNNSLKIIGLVDIKKLEKNIYTKYPIFVSIDELMQKQNPNVIIVATNDNTHEEIFHSLKKYNFSGIISEKPLVSSMEQFNSLTSFFQTKKVSVNYVERFSKIINDFKYFQNNNPINIIKGTFFWGKDRYKDKRQTMGVYADITHPLDLLLFLLNPKNIILNVTNFTEFNYSATDETLIDSISINIHLDNIPITGHSSFLWPSRKRELIFFAEDISNPNTTYQIKMIFDNPLWDRDSIQIIKYSKNEKEIILNKNYPDDTYIDKLDQLNKVKDFLENSINSFMLKDTAIFCELSDAKKNIMLINEIQNQIQLKKKQRVPNECLINVSKT